MVSSPEESMGQALALPSQKLVQWKNMLRKSSALSMALLELLKQIHTILLTFRVSFKTMKLLKMLCQVLAPQEMEFLRESWCLKSDLVQGTPPDAPALNFATGTGWWGERSRGIQGRTLEILLSSQKYLGEMTDQLSFILCPALIPFFPPGTQVDAQRWSSITW